MLRKSLFAMSCLFIFMSLFVVSVEAHSVLQKTYPRVGESLDKPPAKMELWFEDPVVIHSESIKVRNDKGEEVQKGKPFVDSRDKGHMIVFLDDNLPFGVYIVRFHVIALDGYVIRDSFQFTIKEPSSDQPVQTDLKLVKSSPGDGEIVREPLDQIDLWFNQPAQVSAIGVFGKINYVAAKEPYINPDNPNHVVIPMDEEAMSDTYQVSWYAFPVDEANHKMGMDSQGIFYFAINEEPSLVSDKVMPSFHWFSESIGIKHLAHSLAFIGLLTLLGGSWFYIIIARGSGNAQRWRKASWLLYGLALCGFILLLVQRRFELASVPFAEFATIQFVWIPAVQALLLSIGFILSGKLRIFFITLSVVLWPFASGHSTYPRYGGVWSAGMDIVHLLSVSVWMGGLLALLIMIPKENGLPWVKNAGNAYSKWAVWSLILIVLTGIGMTLQFVPSFSLGSLLVSDWGKALLIKVILVIGITGLGYWQRRFLRNVSEKVLSLFIRRGRIELVYAVFILFAAAILIESSPGSADQGVYPKSLAKEELELSVDITPFQMGTNDIILRFKNKPDLEKVKVRIFMPPEWKKENIAFSLGGGEYKVTGNFLHASGTMYMEAEAYKSNGEIVVFPFRLSVPGEMRLYE
jgi:copper transport protein